MTPITIIVGGLVTWRLSRMVVKETGPFAIFARLRAFLAVKQKRPGGLYDLVSCVSCASIYIGALTALWLAGDVFEFTMYTFAFSAIAVLTERLFTKL